MAVNALHSAATGMNALSTELDVISNNLANVNTNAFKASRVNFEDLFYLQKRQPGLESGAETTPPAGLQVGLGTRISNTQYDFSGGSLVASPGDFDMAITGDGFFQVEIIEEYGGGIGYTRAGNFTTTRDNEIVLGNSDGPRLAGGITVPVTVPPCVTSISGMPASSIALATSTICSTVIWWRLGCMPSRRHMSCPVTFFPFRSISSLSLLRPQPG